MYRKTLPLSLILVISFLLSGCFAFEQDPWITYANRSLGFSVRLPKGWILEENNNSIFLANDQKMMDFFLNKHSEDAIIDGAGTSISIGTTNIFQGANEPLGMMKQFLESFIVDERFTLELTEEPHETTINDQSAASTTLEGMVSDSLYGTIRITIVVKGDDVALIMALDTSENRIYGNTLERITQSLIFR